MYLQKAVVKLVKKNGISFFLNFNYLKSTFEQISIEEVWISLARSKVKIRRQFHVFTGGGGGIEKNGISFFFNLNYLRSLNLPSNKFQSRKFG